MTFILALLLIAGAGAGIAKIAAAREKGAVTTVTYRRPTREITAVPKVPQAVQSRTISSR